LPGTAVLFFYYHTFVFSLIMFKNRKCFWIVFCTCDWKDSAWILSMCFAALHWGT